MDRELVIRLLGDFKNANKEKYGIEAIGIFGSVARDETTPANDIDICIKTDKADLFAMVHIKEELETLMASPIDLVKVRESMNPFLKKRIENEAIYV